MTPRWWQRPWIAPLAVLSLIFLVFSLPPYLAMDPAQSRVPQSFELHYPLLVAHVLCGSIAMLTGLMQIWPWLRQRHPRVHRISGRVYVLAGVLPAGLLGLVIGAMTPFGPVLAVSNVSLAALWLFFTYKGFRAARAKRFRDHRKWMIRSFALTFSIILNRIYGVIAAITLIPQLDTTFGGSEAAMQQAIAGIAGWLGWTSALLFAQWRLERGRPSAAFAGPAREAQLP